MVVAAVHPRAGKIVAVDLSEASLSRLRMRIAFAKLARFFRPLPKIQLVCADLHEWGDQPFDFILASNMLQTAPDPAALLGRLASMLAPEGILRMVTYPKESRFWIYETSKWLHLQGLHPSSPHLVRACDRAIGMLPDRHPIRSCFESHPETKTAVGLVDAFFHACDNPLSPLQWREASAAAGLTLIGETQTESSRSSFLDEIVPEVSLFDPWLKLEILDLLHELCAKPILWFRKGNQTPKVVAQQEKRFMGRERLSLSPRPDTISLSRGQTPEEVAQRCKGANPPILLLPSWPRWKIAAGLRRAESLLEGSGVSLPDVCRRLEKEVGPRVSPPPRERILPGLAIVDYPLGEMRSIPEPWSDGDWSQLEMMTGDRFQIYREGGAIPGRHLAEQAEWLQVRYGPEESFIPVEIKKVAAPPV